MKLVKWAWAGSLLMAIPSVTLAQDAMSGIVTTIDRIAGTVAIRQATNGTVGASNGGATEQFKAPSGALDSLHAGDSVKFSVSENDGKKTITKIERQ